MDITIDINIDNIGTAVSELQKIETAVSARNLTIAMDSSLGEFSEELKDMAAALRESGNAFQSIVSRTIKVLKEAGTEFSDADETAGKQFL